MTEAEWLTCTDPAPQLEFLGGKGGERQLRLFIAACCRRVRPLLPDEPCRHGVEVAERWANGRCTEQETDEAYRNALSAADAVMYLHRIPVVHTLKRPMPAVVVLAIALRRLDDPLGLWDAETSAPVLGGDGAADRYRQALGVCKYAAAAVAVAADRRREKEGAVARLWGSATRTAHAVGGGTVYGYRPGDAAGIRAWNSESRLQAALLRDVVAIPFRRLPAVPREVLAWNDGTVRHLAEAIYEERAFENMPILGDALEDAGCDDADILNHCREPRIHVRGCWVVDLLLGKS
jgi:hypothetical protein